MIIRLMLTMLMNNYLSKDQLNQFMVVLDALYTQIISGSDMVTMHTQHPILAYIDIV